MSAPLLIVQDGREIVVRGNALRVLRDGGFRAPYIGTVRGWMLDGRRLPDLVAYLESRRIPYRVTESGDAA